MNIHWRRRAVLPVLALTLTAGIGVPPYAAVPDAGGVVHGCFNITGASKGSLRVIDTDAGEQCKKYETALDGNQQGPTGDPGADGPAGPQEPAGPQGEKGDTWAPPDRRVTPARPGHRVRQERLAPKDLRGLLGRPRPRRRTSSESAQTERARPDHQAPARRSPPPRQTASTASSFPSGSRRARSS